MQTNEDITGTEEFSTTHLSLGVDDNLKFGSINCKWKKTTGGKFAIDFHFGENLFWNEYGVKTKKK